MTNTINYDIPKAPKHDLYMVKKVLLSLVIIIFSLSMFLTILYSSSMTTIFDIDNFNTQFEKNDTSDATNTELPVLLRIMQKTLDFLNGKIDSMQSVEVIDGIEQEVFYDDELSHMLDVKILFDNIKVAGITATILLILTLLYFAIFNKNINKSTLKGILKVLLGVGCVIVFLILVASIDFHEAFNIFHAIFFPQGNWLFPPYSFMIQMLPESLFFDFTTIILFKAITLLLDVVLLIILLIRMFDLKSKLKNNVTTKHYTI